MYSGIKEPRRVVVTGMGAITAQGTSLASFWDGVSSGRVAIRPMERLPMDGYMTTLGGEVKEQAPAEHDYLQPGGYKEPVLDYALKAAEEAFAHCGIHPSGAIPPERWAVVVGTCNGGLLAGERWYTGTMQGEIRTRGSCSSRRRRASRRGSPARST